VTLLEEFKIARAEQEKKDAVRDAALTAVEQYKSKLPAQLKTWLTLIAAGLTTLAALTGGITLGKISVSQTQIEQAAAVAAAIALVTG